MGTKGPILHMNFFPTAWLWSTTYDVLPRPIALNLHLRDVGSLFDVGMPLTNKIQDRELAQLRDMLKQTILKWKKYGVEGLVPGRGVF